jgi:hypothetical protein
MTDAPYVGFLGHLWQFQPLVAGVLATIAAVATAAVIYAAARLPVKAQEKLNEDTEDRRLRLRSIELSEEYKLLGMRARQGKGTVTVHKASNVAITDETRRKMTLHIPRPTRDWQFMTLIPEAVARECVSLNGLIKDHNFDMERAGGAFGDDNFGRSITNRLEAIERLTSALGQKFSNHEQVRTR